MKDERRQPERRPFRMDFIHTMRLYSDGTADLGFSPNPKRYDKIDIDGQIFFEDKFTADRIAESVVESSLAEFFDKPMYFAPPKYRDPCSYLSDCREKLEEHWDDKYVLDKTYAPLLEKLQEIRGERQVIVLYVDMEGSTKLSAELSPRAYRKIMNIFLMQMTKAIDVYNGYVLNYVGDEAIGIFEADVNFTGMCDNAIQAAMMMRNVVEDVINPIFAKHRFPQIGYHIGLDFCTVQPDVVGALDIAAFVTLIGHSMNVAGKIAKRAEHNEILLGKNLFDLLYFEFLEHCKEKPLDNWSVPDPDPRLNRSYQVYRFTSKWDCQ